MDGGNLMKSFIKDGRIDFWDERFYLAGVDKENKNIYYPSVNHILDKVFVKGYMFEQWLKDTGHNSKTIAAIAAEKGTVVHGLIDRMTEGELIDIVETNIEGRLIYQTNKLNFEEYMACLKFADFWNNFVNKLHSSEFVVMSKKHKYAGTADLHTTLINGEVWLIDNKFGNAIYGSYWFQLDAYRLAMEEMGLRVDRCGIMWLKAGTRGRDKSNRNIQGEGWKLVPSPHDYEKTKEIWLKFLSIYYYLYPSEKPKVLQYPSSVKLDEKPTSKPTKNKLKKT